MNLSEPLDGLTTAVEAAVLRVLARADAGFSGRQVHALAGVGSTSSVHRALTGLVRVGVVTAEPNPPSIIYRANREHVLWPVIESGLSARQRAFDIIRGFFDDNVGDEVPAEGRVSAVVYGSVARRESGLDSDIDLFLVFPDGFDDDARADFTYRLAEHVERVTGNEAQVFYVDRSELARRIADDDPLVANVRADGIHLYGDPLPAPLRHAS
ncbi:nucleotidyltransferase domain-containing protein [Microbacterium sp.]|uniref:nucleotidyltransferase domain-containing protein n=1 Tax=Microbacterium sp. TaxID=51671 RepID=UPI0037C9C450